MKSFIKISLIAALLFSSAGLYANEGDFSFSVKGVNEKAVTFVINETQVVDVAIYSANNDVLYQKRTNAKKGTSKTYDLNSLPDGDYTLKMSTDLKVATYNIQIKDGYASVAEPVVTDLLSPVITKKDGFVTLNLVSVPKGALEVEVLDQERNQVYNKVFQGGAPLIKKFDVARGINRELTFIVRSGDQVFAETVQMY